MMQRKPDKRTTPAVARTLDSLKSDVNTFRTKFKGNIKHAMDANNVIDDPIYDIPLDQVMSSNLLLLLVLKNMLIFVFI